MEHGFDMFLFSFTSFQFRVFDFPRLKHHDVERLDTEGYNVGMLKQLEVVDSLKCDRFIGWFDGLIHQNIFYTE